MHKIEFSNIIREFPEGISEMSEAQYRFFSFLELNRQLGRITMDQLEVQFVYFVMDMVRTSNNAHVVENVNELRKLIRPYYTTQKSKKTGKPVPMVDLNFVVNPLPVIKVDNVDFYGPAAALQNCSYEEVFVHAQNALLDFSNTMEEEYLDRLVAIIYRKPLNGKRPIFDAENFEDHLEQIKSLKPEIKFGVYLFFASCQKFITTADALDIGGGNTVNIAQLFKPDPSQGKNKGIGPVGIIYSIAESGVFGNARETGRQGVYDVLIRMVQLHEQAKEMKRNAKRK